MLPDRSSKIKASGAVEVVKRAVSSARDVPPQKKRAIKSTAIIRIFADIMPSYLDMVVISMGP
jgi:hypothetical protein